MATFVDTNVLVYAVDRSEPEKRAIAHGALAEVWQGAVFSAQVLNEYFVTSEDLSHGQVIEGVRIHNPFLT